jgi:hypothetical protein
MARDNLPVPSQRKFNRDYTPRELTQTIDQILSYLEKHRKAGPIRTSTIYSVVHNVTDNVSWSSGEGTPEGALEAPIGSLYTRTDGGASTTLYVKESGTGNTGWIAK